MTRPLAVQVEIPPAQRAAALPAPAVGAVVTVPLQLLPLYYELWHLEPVGRRDDVLICKHVPEEIQS